MNQLHDVLKDIYDQLVGSDGLSKVRARAWDAYHALGLPTRNNERYRHVRLRALYEGQYCLPKVVDVKVPSLDRPSIVLVNGVYRADLSTLPEGIVVDPLPSAMRTYGTFLTNRLSKALKEESDPFAALNGAIHQEALFIYVPPKQVLSEPIHVRHILTGGAESVIVTPRLHIFVGAGAQADFVSSLEMDSVASFWINGVVDVAVEEAARVGWVDHYSDCANSWVFDSLRASLKRNSDLQVVTVARAGNTMRRDLSVALEGENANAALYGAWLLRDGSQGHSSIRVSHRSPHCQSRQLFKNVLQGMARSSFHGVIDVAAEAQKTDAFQLNNNLLLSDRAVAHSQPQLEICADDVKASHGATMGQLDDELLFYCRTRGIDVAGAKRLLVAGFIDEVTAAIPTLSRQFVTQEVASFLDDAGLS